MKKRILIPRNSFGWAGGNHYYEIIVRGLLELERRGNIKTFHIPLPKQKSLSKTKGLLTKYERAAGFLVGIFLVNIIRPSSNLAPYALVWIPDFQELEIPMNFDSDEITERKRILQRSTKTHRRIYLSSYSALEVFEKNFPELKKPAGVIRFNSFLGRELSLKESLEFCEQCATGGYFYTPNQFWLHKNHDLLISAFDSYRSSGGSKHLVLTGSNSDYRDDNYGKNLESRIRKTKNVHYVGVVSRNFQVQLFENAFLLIQPSLYEGWSVSVEEAISFGLPIIASDISANLEQLADYPNASFFQKNSVESLQDLLHQNYTSLDTDTVVVNTNSRHERFLQDLLETIRAYFESVDKK